MSYCGRGSKTRKTNYGTSATKTVNPPAKRNETCNPASSSVITGGGSSTSTTIQVPGPPGPMGPAGPAGAAGLNGWGFKWEGQFELNKQYYAQATAADNLASVVEYAGSTYVAVTDNISTDQDNPEFEPGNSSAWELVAQKGEGTLAGEDADFFESLKDDIFDWWQNATINDIIQAGIGAAGVILAGTVIADILTDDGAGDGEADQRFTGTEGYVTSVYTPPDIKDVLSELCELAGIPYDVDDLPDEPCEFTIGNTTSIRSVINQLSLAYQFELVDTSGTYKFVPRSATPVRALTDADLGFSSSEVPPPLYTAKRYQGIDLPRSVTLTYVSPDSDYNKFTQTSELFTFSAGQDIQLEVPVTLSHVKAKQVTELTLVQAHLERTQFEIVTTYKHIDLEPGDVVSHPKLGVVRIDKLVENQEGLLRFSVVDAGSAESLDPSALEVAIPPASTNIPVELGYSQALFFDPPVLNDADQGVRIYCAVHGYDRPGWPGAQIYVSENGGASYDLLTSVYTQSTIGVVGTAVASADYFGWDNDTVITVTLKTGSLLSRSESEVLNGRNRAMIGNEIIGFKTATLTGPKTYQLSGLLRGRQGTEQFIDTHEADELFVLLDTAIVRLPWGNIDRDSTKKYKVVTIGSSLDKVDAQDVQMRSNNLRLWTPHSVELVKLGSDFRATFKERVRYENGLRDGAEIEHDPDWAGFGIAVYDGASIIKLYTTTSEIWTYTAAMQTADFGSVQSTLEIAVTQLSRLGAPGYPVIVNT